MTFREQADLAEELPDKSRDSGFPRTRVAGEDEVRCRQCWLQSVLLALLLNTLLSGETAHHLFHR